MNNYASFLFSLLFGFLLLHQVNAQNLVPNGSFEEVIECPTTLSALHEGCADWYASIQVPNEPMNGNPSPDWFHGCSVFDELSPPNVLSGFQEPFEGVGLAGIVTYASGFANEREIMGVQLTEATNVGEVYLVKFHTVWGHFFNGSIKSNNLGVRFTTYPIFESTEEALSNFSHFKIDTLVTDSVSWLNVEFEFIADSAYNYIQIGNFYNDELTITETTEGDGNAYAYYFIDNVSVQSTLSVAELDPVMEIFPNPFNAVLTINSQENIKGYQLFDVSGRLVISELGSFNDQFQLETAFLHKGVYFLQLLDVSDSTYMKKIIKQ